MKSNCSYTLRDVLTLSKIVYQLSQPKRTSLSQLPLALTYAPTCYLCPFPAPFLPPIWPLCPFPLPTLPPTPHLCLLLPSMPPWNRSVLTAIYIPHLIFLLHLASSCSHERLRILLSSLSAVQLVKIDCRWFFPSNLFSFAGGLPGICVMLRGLKCWMWLIIIIIIIRDWPAQREPENRSLVAQINSPGKLAHFSTQLVTNCNRIFFDMVHHYEVSRKKTILKFLWHPNCGNMLNLLKSKMAANSHYYP